ncbi:hypothetical protein NDU88_008428 [Pleurodeles waltl]|uniref:Uncharacterized protein n=1 Tax=Pleurodeles waltl TaxID=8319 RepID=A0AAV7PRW4_PLEWA|nr:hypothetical protein NDU88_008428 [Pleurodeles waltl]
MADDCIWRALALLKKAGHMDLMNTEALVELRPARKVSQGVVAVVLACSPLRRARNAEVQVRSGGWVPGRAAGREVGWQAAEAPGGSLRIRDTLRKPQRVSQGNNRVLSVGGT